MGFSPNNLCIYVYAICGYNGGLIASRNQPTSQDESAYFDAAARADFFAQAVDAAWGTAGYTTADLLQIQAAAAALLASGASPVPGAAGLTPGGYAEIAVALVAGVQAGTAQIVSESINPNGCSGASSTGAFISVTTRGALIALSTLGLLKGQLAYVQSPKTYWSYDPTSTTPANGVTVLLASGGGRWIDITPTLVVSPFQYGAVGDGRADDTIPCQSALADAIAASAILKLDGQFRTTAPLDASGAARLFIQGVGGVSGIYPTAATGPALTANDGNYVHLTDFVINGSGGTCQDGILLIDCTSWDIDINILGGGVGFTRAGISIGFSVANCYAIHVGGSVLIDHCAGDSYQILPGASHQALSIGPGAVFQDAGGWNLNANGGIAHPSQMTAEGFVFQGGALGEMTGSVWASSFIGHLESVGNNISCVKFSPGQFYRGLKFACFMENHSTGTGYCLDFHLTATSLGLVADGCLFDLAPTAAVYLNGAFVNGTLGPNDYNGAYIAGAASSNLAIFDAGRGYEQQAILRTYALGNSGMIECSGKGVQSTSGVVPSTVFVSLPITSLAVTPAAFNGSATIDVTVVGRDTTSADSYTAILRLLVSNRAGVITIGAGGVITVFTDYIGGGTGATLPTIAASATAGNIDVTMKGWTIAGTPPIDWTVMYYEVNRP